MQKIQRKIIVIGVATLSAYLLLTATCIGQNVSINSTGAVADSSAALDVSSTNKGVLIPRVALGSTTDILTVPSPAVSLMVYNTNANMLSGNGVGYYAWDGSKWEYMISASNGSGQNGEVLTSTGAGNQPQWTQVSSSSSNCQPSEMSTQSTSSMDLKGCMNYCFNLTQGGKSDWRVPSIEEFINLTPAAPANTVSTWAWTVTSSGETSDVVLVRMSDIQILNTTTNWTGGYCRCIR